MKYALFAMAIFGIPPLAWLLSINGRWLKHAFWGMSLALCLYQGTAINFFSNEMYRGSARGMEVSLVYLLCAAIILALVMAGRRKRLFPDVGTRLFAVYFLLCLPSLSAAENVLFGFFELWKMVMLGIVMLATYWFLEASNDIETPVAALAVVVIGNFAALVMQHFGGIYQPGGIFQHRNCMAMAMLLVGPIFFVGWLERGWRSPFGILCGITALLACGCTIRSYSRGAIALAPVAYGIAVLACLIGETHKHLKLSRLAPFALVGFVGLCAIAPRVIERFRTAPESSANTRIELAACAREMIFDEPVRGIGINNWGIKINPPWPYAELAGRNTGRGADFEDGVVETVYLLVAAECGLPALFAMVAWFGWYLFACLRCIRALRGTRWRFVPAGLLGGLTANYLQSFLEWVLRQQMNLIILAMCFAMIAFLDNNRHRLVAAARAGRRRGREGVPT